MSPKQALQAEFLPENLLVKTNDTLVWWTPEQHRPMYFSVAQGKATEVEGMSGKVFPHPALVFVVNDGRLFVRALKTNKRPTPDTDLFIAPYWNVYDTGSVCLGSMKHPRTYGISAIAGWENGFFDSYFAHPNTPLLTRHKEGIVDLWASLQGSTEKYPARTLVPAKQKLAGLLK
jgi:PRTRC genetic system protein B